MKSISNNGISVCPTGEERYVYFSLLPRNRKKHCQYDYRHTDGQLYSTVAPSLEKCREKRDKWLADRIIQNEPTTHTNNSDCLYYIPASYAVCSTCKIGGYCSHICEKFVQR